MKSEFKVKIASLLFGVGSWITITGFWAELPLLISSLPEKWKLSSQLTFFIQAANVGPLIFWICRHFNFYASVVGATHVQMVIGVVACIALMTSWDTTFYVFGQERSIILLASAFGLSLVDCTSSVTFLPFMARFNPVHLTPYLIGEGLSGFIPIVLALIQGVGESGSCDELTESIENENKSCYSNENCDDDSIGVNSLSEPLFSQNVFFTSLLVTLLISWVAFFWLLNSSDARTEHVDEAHQGADGNKITKVDDQNEGNRKYFILQGIIIYACLSTFGVMPSIQSYSTLPYGEWALHYAVVFGGLAYPFGCLIAMLKHVTSMKIIYSLTAIGTIMSIMILVVACLSPTPPLLSDTIVAMGITSKAMGGTIMVVSWTLYITVFSYVKTVITVIVSADRGEQALFTVGLFTQIGSVAGAGFMFLAVNYFQWFQEC